MNASWIDSFPALMVLPEAERTHLQNAAKPVSFNPGDEIFGKGKSCRSYLFMLEGSVRVQLLAESGREIVLYRVDPGEVCILTTVCLLTGQDYGADGVAESHGSAMVLSQADFERLISGSHRFRQFVFAAYGLRVADLLLLIEEVAFGHIDVRLSRFLQEHCDEHGELFITHQQLAVELGTAREVISRQLKDFERRSWVTLKRGCVTVTDHKALEARARLSASVT